MPAAQLRRDAPASKLGRSPRRAQRAAGARGFVCRCGLWRLAGRGRDFAAAEPRPKLLNLSGKLLRTGEEGWRVGGREERARGDGHEASTAITGTGIRALTSCTMRLLRSSWRSRSLVAWEQGRQQLLRALYTPLASSLFFLCPMPIPPPLPPCLYTLPRGRRARSPGWLRARPSASSSLRLSVSAAGPRNSER